MKALRRLGFGELRMHLIHAEFLGTTQGALGVRVCGPVDTAALPGAVARLAGRYTMLRAVIMEGADGEYRFHEHTALTSRSLLRLSHEETPAPGVQAMERANAELINPAQQLWRLHCVSYAQAPEVHDLVLVMHHAAMDATGADMILGELLTILSGESAPASAVEGFPDSLEESCLVSVPWSDFARASKDMAAHTAACHPPQHRAIAPLGERDTVITSFNLDAQALGKLERRCREEGVSLNACFSAALMKAVARAMPERQRMALYTAVSLRRLCPDLDEAQLGCCLSVIPSYHDDPAQKPLLALASEQAQHLQEAFLKWATPPQDYPVKDVKSTLRGAHDAMSFFNDIGFTYAESNLQQTYGPLSVSSVQVIARRLMGNVALILHGLRHGQRIFFTLSHTCPLFDDVCSSLVQREFENLLHTESECT